MTDKQTSYYRALWNKARKANAWHMQNCRLQNAELPVLRSFSEGVPAIDNEPEKLRRVVITVAHQVARKEHRAPVERDLRLACHHVAIGRACSSAKISGKEFTRVKALLQVLADPLDLAALNEWLHPENDIRRRLLQRIKQTHTPEAIIRAISENACGIRDWDQLDNEDLTRLANILESKQRRAA